MTVDDRTLAQVAMSRAEYERQGNRHRLIKVHGVLEQLHTALGDPLAAARAGREHFRLRTEGKLSGHYVDASGQMVAFHRTPGYETYDGLGWYGVIVQTSG